MLNIQKKISVLCAAFMLAVPVVGTVTTRVALADADSSSATQTMVVNQGKVGSSSNVSSQTSKQVLDSIKSHAKITRKNGVTTLTISDSDLELAINESYGTLFASSAAKRRKVAGVTKVKNYGHGNINIYLSKNTLNTIRRSSMSAAINLLFGLIGAAASVDTAGTGVVVARSLASKLAGAMLSQVGAYKVGRVYKIRNWKYAGWRYQYK